MVGAFLWIPVYLFIDTIKGNLQNLITVKQSLQNACGFKIKVRMLLKQEEIRLE